MAAALTGVALLLLLTTGVSQAAAPSPTATLKWVGWGTDLVGRDSDDQGGWVSNGLGDGQFSLSIAHASGKTVEYVSLYPFTDALGGGLMDTSGDHWLLAVEKRDLTRLNTSSSDWSVSIPIVRGRVSFLLNTDGGAQSQADSYFASGSSSFVIVCFDVALEDCIDTNSVTTP